MHKREQPPWWDTDNTPTGSLSPKEMVSFTQKPGLMASPLTLRLVLHLSVTKKHIEKANDGNSHSMGREDQGSRIMEEAGNSPREDANTAVIMLSHTIDRDKALILGKYSRYTVNVKICLDQPQVEVFGRAVKRCGVMYREKSTELELQTLILLLDQSPSFSLFWPQMKLIIPYHRAVRYMS